MTNNRPPFNVVLGLVIICVGIFWDNIREWIPELPTPNTPVIDIIQPDSDALLKVSDIASMVKEAKDRLELCVFNKVFADRLLAYSTDAQQINDVYTLAAKNIFGSSLKGKYTNLGAELTNLMRSVIGEENHILSMKEKEGLNRYFMALAWRLNN